MKKSILKLPFVLIITITLSIDISTSFAQSPSLTNGLSYLQSTQSPAGNWGDAAEVPYNSFIDTCVVAETLKYLNETGATYNSGIQWINTIQVSNNGYLFTKMFVLAQAGFDVTTIRDYLLSIRNNDGGWGAAESYSSDIKRTALSLLALKAANYTDQSVISSALGYLISIQNVDGGFGFYSGDDSNVYMTAMVVNTLLQYKASYNLQASINNGVSYLLTKQNADGGFGLGSSTVYETALVYQILVRTIYDPIAWAKAESYLLTTQNTNGSWNQDAYSTALSLRALYDAERLRASQIQSVDLYKAVNNQLQLTTDYDAYDRMVIKININDPNVRFDIQVRDAAGNIYNVSIINGEIIFDTANYPPGTYTIIIRAIDITTGMVVDEESITFTIHPVIVIPSINLGIQPVSSYVSATADITLNAYISNQSNITGNLTIGYEIKTPSNNIINSGSINVSIAPAEANKLIPLAQFTYQFQEAGEYPITANVYSGADLLTSSSMRINVSPLVRIEPKKTLTPSTVAPDGDKRIRIEIELEGK